LIINAAFDTQTDGLEIARQLRQCNPTTAVILLASQSSEDLAIAALKAHVNDYFKAPFSYEELLTSVRCCLGETPLAPITLLPIDKGMLQCTPSSNVMPIIGNSTATQAIKATIAKVAASDSTVLITGETGTGKELVAAAIHGCSRRQQKPFVDLNCAAIPDSLLESELFGYEKGAFTGAQGAYEGKLKLAHGGTIFFDEIGDMSPYAQAKVLRVLENRRVQSLRSKKGEPVDIRVIAATNQDLEHLMGDGRFRRDLYYRLNVTNIHLPPLRERHEDIPILFDHYIGEFNQQFGRKVHGFTDDALECLLRYSWPGNVRELRNLTEAIFVNTSVDRISLLDLPALFRRHVEESADQPQDERAQVLASLLATNWNKSKAAQKLHWSRITLYRKMWKHHLVKKGEIRTGSSPS
jgi:DNA-binding NtrC family response regulator